MAIELNNGVIGQEKGPFNENTSFSFVNGAKGTFIKLGISIGEKDLMQKGQNGFYFTIDGQPIYMKFSFDEVGKEQFLLTKPCLYETERYTEVSTVSFPQGAPASVILEYSVQSIGD